MGVTEFVHVYCGHDTDFILVGQPRAVLVKGREGCAFPACACGIGPKELCARFCFVCALSRTLKAAHYQVLLAIVGTSIYLFCILCTQLHNHNEASQVWL